MTLENYSLWISVGTLFVLLFTLIVLYLNLKIARQAMQDQHKWYRRVEALKYSGFFHPKLSEYRIRINESFNNLNNDDEITLTNIQEKIKINPRIEFDIRYMLSYYENIAFAISIKAIDGEVVKVMKKGAFKKFYNQFKLYIEDAEKKSNNNSLWIHFVKLAKKWNEDDLNKAEEVKKLGI